MGGPGSGPRRLFDGVQATRQAVLRHAQSQLEFWLPAVLAELYRLALHAEDERVRADCGKYLADRVMGRTLQGIEVTGRSLQQIEVHVVYGELPRQGPVLVEGEATLLPEPQDSEPQSAESATPDSQPSAEATP